jgi:hypothetical protein
VDAIAATIPTHVQVLTATVQVQDLQVLYQFAARHFLNASQEKARPLDPHSGKNNA